MNFFMFIQYNIKDLSLFCPLIVYYLSLNGEDCKCYSDLTGGGGPKWEVYDPIW